MLDNLTPGQEDYKALLALLEDTTYRASLQNLLPPSSSHSADHVTAMAAFALGDELVTVHADYPGKVWIDRDVRGCPGGPVRRPAVHGGL